MTAVFAFLLLVVLGVELAVVYALARGVPMRPQLSGASVPQTYLAQVKKVGGSAGDATNPPTFTYDVWYLDGDINEPDERILTAATPYYGRTEAGRYRESREAELALMFREPLQSHEWRLLLVLDEIREVATCDGS